MAEIQQSTNSADLTQRFIEFVMMNAQQAALCLGQMAHPSTGKAEVNLDAARMFIDHLEVVQEKTRGNLNKDEDKILAGVLTELRLAFVQVSNQQQHGSVSGSSPAPAPVYEAPSDASGGGAESPSAPAPAPTGEEEGKKKFSKSYGA